MRRWLVMAVAFPLGAWALARVADQLAAQRGEGKVTQLMRAPHEWRRNHR